MARKGLIESNNRKKRLVAQFRAKRGALKALAMNRSGDLLEKMELFARLARMPRNSSKVRVRSRCAISGRARAVYRFFGISRIALREEAMRGHLPGVTRSSW